ncbi:2,6-dihydropseudooxynicotine hydrolase [Tolypocladium capitatum]|uniref:2,6-dihydropseudooxynicotine hydrolase n=1 Tax=Tolypocladium capitatum TaxID=45235 RepID=A0A2K3QJ42_9HYPO|nr:2,6-dihydropseudooxynicotine hydrolase [Tolypocladium capitatum]
MANPDGTLLRLNEDPIFHFGILRFLSLSVYDGADIGEVLAAANGIIPGDFESFSAAFAGLAARVYRRASIALARSPVSAPARTAFFSAATYFRSADFFLHGDPGDPRIVDLWAKQTDAFDQGLALLNPPGRRLTVSTPDFDIPAIWFTPSDEVKPRPTIVMSNGYDGAQEEMYHIIGLAALERGYNVLTYEGPGQPSVRRHQNLGFISDWERVVTPLMDHVLSMTDHVDPGAVGLLGLSLGGYHAPRAAAFDHRFAAVMAIDGVWDFGAVLRRDLGPELMALHAAGRRAEFDARVRQGFLEPGAPTSMRWGLEQGMWSFNTRSPYDFATRMARHTLRDVAHRIRTPTLVGAAEEDMYFRGQPEQLAAALGKWAHLREFRNADAIGTHCGIGALKQQSAVVLDWFQGVLDAAGCRGEDGEQRGCV